MRHATVGPHFCGWPTHIWGLHLKEVGPRPESLLTHLSIPIPGCMLSGLPLYSVYNESREAYLLLNATETAQSCAEQIRSG